MSREFTCLSEGVRGGLLFEQMTRLPEQVMRWGFLFEQRAHLSEQLALGQVSHLFKQEELLRQESLCLGFVIE
jgi:hypothetical protein